MITLLRDNIAVVPIFDPDMSPGGIIIPDMAKERCDQGIVKYIGPKTKILKAGDYVIFSGYTGTMVRIEDEGRLIIMPEKFVVAHLPDPSNVEVEGLYFKGRDGNFFRATYEMAMEIIADSFTDSEWRSNLGIKNKIASRPTLEEYNSVDDDD